MKKNLKLFERLAAFPNALILLAFLFPLVNISCSEVNVASPNAYELARGVTPEALLDDKDLEVAHEMEKNEPRMKEFLGQPILTSRVIIPIVIEVVLAVAFAFVSPIGSLAMGVAAFVSLWVFLVNLSATVQRENYGFLTVEPAVGAYCITFLLAIGIAMNLAAIILRRRQAKLEQTKAPQK